MSPPVLAAEVFHIAHIAPYLSRRGGGIFEITTSLAKATKDLGIDVSAYGITDEFMNEDISRWGNVPVHQFQPFLSKKLAFSLQVQQRLNRGDWDILHQHGLWTGISFATLRSYLKTGRPHVVSPHGMLDRWALRNSVFKKFLAGILYEWKNLRTAACLIVNTTSEMQTIREVGISVPIAVIPNGIELPSLPLRKDGGQKQLLYLGRLHPKKGVFELIEAWSRLPAMMRASWKLVLAGWDDGGHLAGLQSRAEELGIKSFVEFPGPVFGHQKEKLFGSSAGFILPSFSEGLPMAVLEAWAHGLPTIITPGCNLEIGLTTGCTWMTTTDPEDICQSLQQLMECPTQQRIEMGRRARILAETQFTWHSVATMHSATYKWVLGKADRPNWVHIQS